MMPNLLRAALLFLTLLASTACSRPPTSYQPPATTARPGAASTGAVLPQLLFLSARMLTPSPGKRTFELIQAKSVSGEIPGQLAEEFGSTYLLITQLDPQGRPCGPPTKAPHPLLRDVEAPGPNGTLVRQQTTLAEAEFFVRMPLQPLARTVRVEEVGTGFERLYSTTFSLDI